MAGGLPSWCWDDDAARRKLEDVVWARGRRCPHCGERRRHRRLEGRRHRPGLFKCGACRRQFTATVGTFFHGSHLPLRKWFLALHLLYLREPGASAREVERWLGVTYKTAWTIVRQLEPYGLDDAHDLDVMIRRLCAPENGVRRR